MQVINKLWLWGHESGSHSVYKNLPKSKISPIEACESLGIRNLIMVDFNGKPVPPFQEIKPRVDKLLWSATGAGGRKVKIEDIIKIDVDGIIFDDFFNFYSEGKNFYMSDPKLSINEIKRIKDLTKNPLWVVIYAGQSPEKIKDYFELFDVINLWVWYPEALNRLEEIIHNFKIRFPNKKRALGLYMYDYSSDKELKIGTMQRQCKIALKALKDNSIQEIVLLASCICDLNLESVEFTKRWIKKNGEIVL